MLVRVRILKAILPYEMPGQIRQMSPQVAQIREANGTVELLPAIEVAEAKMPPIETTAMADPPKRRRMAR